MLCSMCACSGIRKVVRATLQSRWLSAMLLSGMVLGLVKVIDLKLRCWYHEYCSYYMSVYLPRDSLVLFCRFLLFVHILFIKVYVRMLISWWLRALCSPSYYYAWHVAAPVP